MCDSEWRTRFSELKHLHRHRMNVCDQMRDVFGSKMAFISLFVNWDRSMAILTFFVWFSFSSFNSKFQNWIFLSLPPVRNPCYEKESHQIHSNRFTHSIWCHTHGPYRLILFMSLNGFDDWCRIQRRQFQWSILNDPVHSFHFKSVDFLLCNQSEPNDHRAGTYSWEHTNKGWYESSRSYAWRDIECVA